MADVAEFVEQVLDNPTDSPPDSISTPVSSGSAASNDEHVSKFWVCGFSMGAMHAAAVAAGMPHRIRGVGIFGPTDPHAGGAYDGGCCGCAGPRCAHPRWHGLGGCFSMIRLASCCRPLILTPAADAIFAFFVWLALGMHVHMLSTMRSLDCMAKIESSRFTTV
eukprot:SAG31_NODE_1797_length_7244_cov_8.328621_5_plen_164_part_00